MLAGGRYTHATLLNASGAALSSRSLHTQVRRSARGRRTRTASCGRAAACRQQRRWSPPSASSWTAGWCSLQPRPPGASSPAPAAAAGLSQRASTWTDGADGRRSRPRSPAISRGPQGHPDRLVAPLAPPAPRSRPQWPCQVAGTAGVASVGDRPQNLVLSIAGILAISRNLPERWTCYDHPAGLGWCGRARRVVWWRAARLREPTGRAVHRSSAEPGAIM